MKVLKASFTTQLGSGRMRSQHGFPWRVCHEAVRQRPYSRAHNVQPNLTHYRAGRTSPVEFISLLLVQWNYEHLRIGSVFKELRTSPKPTIQGHRYTTNFYANVSQSQSFKSSIAFGYF